MVEATLTHTLRNATKLSKASQLFYDPHPHVATVWRWATKGTRGVKLQTWMLGGHRVTTPQAVEAFLQALNAAAPVAESTDDATRRAREAGKALGC